MPPNPINIYAKTKLEDEHKTLIHDVALIVRTNFFDIGRPWRLSFSDWIINILTMAKKLRMFEDAYFTPLSLDHLCEIILEIFKGRTVFPSMAFVCNQQKNLDCLKS